jgi:mRNA interferase HigB
MERIFAKSTLSTFNAYRLVVKLNFEKQWIFIRLIGTLEEYDKIDANTI